jgi:DNA processing protein
MFGRHGWIRLLGRGFLLSQAVERWNARAIWVVSRADADYPRRFKTRLKEDAPPLLYGCGDAALLEKGGLAVVGSRHVDDDLIAYTEQVGRVAAEAQRTLISGAARGIDRAAMNGALQAGGTVAGVMSDSLERAAVAGDNREFLMDKRLVLVSPYDPAAGFNVGHAMQRNKFIYALADAALVVSADFQKGGTWEGAIEQLERLHFVPVFVRNGNNGGKGNRALIQHGGRPWPEPHNGDDLIEAMKAAAADVAAEPKQGTLYHEVRLGANVRINALAAWRVFQTAMSRPRLHATSTAKSISGAMNATQCHLPLLPPCQRRRPVSPGRVPFAQPAGLINHPAQ